MKKSTLAVGGGLILTGVLALGVGIGAGWQKGESSPGIGGDWEAVHNSVIRVENGLEAPSESHSTLEGVLARQSRGNGNDLMTLSPSQEVELALDDFSIVRTSGAWKVRMTQGEVNKVVVRAPESRRFAIRVVESGSSISFELADSLQSQSWSGAAAQLDITLVAPGEWQSSGVSELDFRNLALSELSLEVSGVSQVKAAGRVGRLKMEVSGKGEWDMGTLEIGRAQVEASGQGNFRLYVPGGKVFGDLSGWTTLELRGRPEVVDVDASGPSKVLQE